MESITIVSKLQAWSYTVAIHRYVPTVDRTTAVDLLVAKLTNILQAIRKSVHPAIDVFEVVQLPLVRCAVVEPDLTLGECIVIPATVKVDNIVQVVMWHALLLLLI